MSDKNQLEVVKAQILRLLNQNEYLTAEKIHTILWGHNAWDNYYDNTFDVLRSMRGTIEFYKSTTVGKYIAHLIKN